MRLAAQKVVVVAVEAAAAEEVMMMTDAAAVVVAAVPVEVTSMQLSPFQLAVSAATAALGLDPLVLPLVHST